MIGVTGYMEKLPIQSKKKIAAVIAMAATTILGFEGYKSVPYLDSVNKPTVCIGHTGGVDMGRIYSKAECDELMRGDLGKAFQAVDRCIHVPLSDQTKAALASFTFNVGGTALCSSTLAVRLNRGEGAPACDELLKWVYAGGRKVAGLLKRRQFERELCIEGFQT